MDYSQLDAYNQEISNYVSSLGIDVEDLKTAADEKINELKQKGQDLLETFIPIEAVTSKLLESGGFQLTEVPNYIGTFASEAPSMLSRLGGGVVDLGAGAVEDATAVASKIGQYAQQGYRLAQGAYAKVSNPTASRLPAEADPEFGVSDEALASSLQGAASRIPGVSSFISRSGAGSDMVDLSALRVPQYGIGSDVAKISDAVPDVAGTVQKLASAGNDIISEAPLAGESLAAGATEAATTIGTDAAVGAGLEAVGAAADATGFGAPLGIVLGIAGAIVGGYSLVKGFEDMFSKQSDTVVAPNVPLPQFQAS